MVYYQQILNFTPSTTDVMISLLREEIPLLREQSSSKKWFYKQKETRF